VAVWTTDPAERALCEERLGWLDVTETMPSLLPQVDALVAAVRAEGLRHVVLLGMGGSSLAAEVYAQVFGTAADHPELIVVDTTDPLRIARVDATIDLAATLFLVASKSGGTLETDCLRRYFFERVTQSGVEAPGAHFVAITDPGSPLAERARAEGYRAVFENPADIGGRFSALSLFGLVPAALIGIDVRQILAAADREATACGPGIHQQERPCQALLLGAAMGAYARNDIDKMTFLCTPELSSLAAWTEQLVAESTGKLGWGVVPIIDEPAGAADGDDRFYVQMAPQGRPCPSAPKGAPVVYCLLSYPHELGALFFRFEMATVLAARLLGVEPFDQPDVAAAKQATSSVLAGEGPEAFECVAAAEHFELLVPAGTREGWGVAGEEAAVWLRAFSAARKSGEHLAVLSYVSGSPAHAADLQAVRGALAGRTGVATSLSIGPRYLHSSGQLHKGGPDAVAVVLLEGPAVGDSDRTVPGRGVTFGQVFAAQAEGDARALAARRRPLLRVRIKGDAATALKELRAAFRR